MAAVIAAERAFNGSNGLSHPVENNEDPFMESDQFTEQPYFHRFSSRFELDAADLGAASSPSQIKRVLEAHLVETERRLQDTHKLGTTLLQQQSELQDKLQEVEQQQDEAEISPELRQRLASIGREHDDVSREIARSLLAPKSRVVSGEEGESTTLSSQATGSPTKISAPNRRSRNQPMNRAGDLQFAADISTSLLAQVRQLQTAVAERDEAIKLSNTERSKLEQDLQGLAQRLRTYDENEQKYKDENWNLGAQNQELQSAQREAADKEKRLNATIAIANAEKIRLMNDIEETRLAHTKIAEDHKAAKKAHETELHGLKRDFDAADSERSTLQLKIDELTSQNHELAAAMATRFRNQSPQRRTEFEDEDGGFAKDLSTPEHSPPPSPIKATPRHGGLESETLKSSLHHAHRMIQNLKSNIHREKTEKIELKRMLQDARDELEQRRSDPNIGTATKKQKTRNEIFKKPARPDMLGSVRRPKTDVEMEEENWEDQAESSQGQTGRLRPVGLATDLSDAYQTAHETESNFETADEQHTTESEAFETGVESMAGDSTDELTETESTAPRTQFRGSGKHNRPSLGFGSIRPRDSYLSTASTSAGEEDDDDQMQTPVQPQLRKFQLRNSRLSSSRQTQIYEGTPESIRSQMTSQDSPATVMNSRSPPGVEQSLFAELEGVDEGSSNFSTPARSGISNFESTPSIADTPSKSADIPEAAIVAPKPEMVDSSMMTEPWQPTPVKEHTPATLLTPTFSARPASGSTDAASTRVVSIGDFPLPPSTSSPPVQHVDSGTQYTPQKDITPEAATTMQHFEHPVQYTPSKATQDSPIRGANTFITPPKTVWDEEHESEIGSPEKNLSNSVETPKRMLVYSDVTSQDTTPLSPAHAHKQTPAVLAFSTIVSQQTHPIEPPPSLPPTAPLPAIPAATSKQERTTTGKVASGAATGGILAGAAAALGLSWPKEQTDEPDTAGKEISSSPKHSQSPTTPLQDISGNAVLRKKQSSKDVDLKQGAPVRISSNDQSSQTMLTSDEIQRALENKNRTAAVPVMLPTTEATSPPVPPKPITRSPDLAGTPPAVSFTSTATSPSRPSSASSQRPLTANKQHPPLPSDYKTNIARANSLAQNGPQKKDSNTPAVGSVMGPPLMPASAMRRPKTPADSTRSPSRENATPRVSHSTRQRGNTDSQISRRSSVSSFASELDERFNIRAGPTGNGYEPVPGTDPRMIQAITQTMIGEYLWKYTRKTGSKEMSNTRHRRYFWVHPYTKTLYWSNTDPSLPGAKEGTSRSVPIESIRVVSDENPMPPGLHRKSLEVTTPSRKVKFTASTGQRHETWFNALSYLLLRGEPPDVHGAYSAGGNEITRDDINEFRVSGHEPHLAPVSRQSMSSYNSRTTSGTAKRVSGATATGQRQSLPSNVVSANSGNIHHQNSITRNSSMPQSAGSGRVSRADEPFETDKTQATRAGSVSRVSRMLGSITGRSSRQGNHDQVEAPFGPHPRGPSRASNSIYDASVISATRESADEARPDTSKEEPAGLENVRACCDGKHDVSTLTHRHSDKHRTLNSMSDRINRSMSKRT